MNVPFFLTEQQAKVLAYMQAYFEKNDQLPSAVAMAKHFGWASENAAVRYWKLLQAAGCIEKNDAGKWRFARTKTATPRKDAPLSRAEWVYAIESGIFSRGSHEAATA